MRQQSLAMRKNSLRCGTGEDDLKVSTRQASSSQESPGLFQWISQHQGRRPKGLRIICIIQPPLPPPGLIFLLSSFAFCSYLKGFWKG